MLQFGVSRRRWAVFSAQCANVRHAAIICSDERLPKDAMQHQFTTVTYSTPMLAPAGFVPCR
jgi:hypothetical protein